MKKRLVKMLNVELLLTNIKKTYNLTDEEIVVLSKEKKDITIPITIFSKKLGMLEAISFYLHNELKLKFNEIAKILYRDYQTIWTSYNKAKKKLENDK